MDWYLVLSKPRQERVALEQLQRQGYPAFLPTLRVEQLRRGRMQVSEQALFPRYLFVQLDTGAQGRSWAPIRSTRGVSTLVHFGLQPARVDPTIVDHLRQRQQTQDDAPARSYFTPGETLTITAGPFQGLDAIYAMTDGERRVIVLLELMQQTVRATLDPSAVQRSA